MSSKSFKKVTFLLALGLVVGGIWSGQTYGVSLDQESPGEIVVLAFLSGYKNGTFRPNKVISREETATILYRLYGKPAVETPKEKYIDIEDDRWSKDPIYSLSNKGIINGYEDGTFKPKEAINKAEASDIMCKFAGKEVGEGGTTNMLDIDTHWEENI